MKRLPLILAVLLALAVPVTAGAHQRHHRHSERPRHCFRAHKSDVEEDVIEVESTEQLVEEAAVEDDESA